MSRLFYIVFSVLFLLANNLHAWENTQLDIPIQIEADDPDSQNPRFGIGDVKIVVYIDFYCHVCAKAYENVNKALSGMKDVEVIFKPIGALGSLSYEASRYAIAFNAQGKFNFFVAHMHKFNNHEKSIGLCKDLNKTKFQDDLNSDATISLLARNSLEAKKLSENEVVPIMALVYKGEIKKNIGFLTIDRLKRFVIDFLKTLPQSKTGAADSSGSSQ